MSKRLAWVFLIAFLFSACRDGRGPAAFKTATVRAKKMSMRIDPLPLASEVEILSAGDKVELLRKSEKKFRAGSTEDYWYFARSPSGLEGWMYGGGLSVALAGSSEDNEKKYTEKEITDNLVGKWWELLPDGSTGLRKIYFWPGGKYKYGMGAEDLKEGQYSIRAADRVIKLKDGSPAGDTLEVRFLGQEMRLSGEYEGKNILFRRGDINPEAREVSDERKEKEKEAARKAAEPGKPAEPAKPGPQ